VRPKSAVWRLVFALRQTAEQMMIWSRWRRWHQTVARYYHYQRRGALVPQLQL
jgi:hypothetical protein